MTLLKDVTFAIKISTAEIETADWDRKKCSPCEELSFAHFSIIHAPESHYINKTKNLLLDGSKFKNIFPDMALALEFCYD